jgi:UDP-GlcNAc:undecaprenyl-phosphate GlcNAc-1-phosphate transferase
MTGLVVAAVLTLVTSMIVTPLVRAGALRAGVVAAPRDDRWHQRPTATLGGVAIYVAFVAGIALFGFEPARVAPVLAAATLLFVAGLVDDLVRLRPGSKLAAQIAAAALVVASGLRLPWTAAPATDALVTLVWLVGITNALNLLDNMDGLAAGIAAIACLFLTITFVLNGQTAEAVFTMVMLGAVLGFLVFNFSPASIFMGDCGSMFLGSALGGLALLSDYGRSRNLTAVLATPVLILTIPILDTCLVTVTRKLSGRPVSHGGRDHTSHRLVALGASERRAVAILYALATVSGLCALVVRWLNAGAVLAVLGGVAAFMALFGLYLGRVRIEETEPARERVGTPPSATASPTAAAG